ncbi:flagellar basal body rod protein FlgB [Caproiciproducens sp. MSJ-32]|uniref:flagellar basal body rod protein FlgB n=1 Tax=Caproiciproducens sp. MSJ-32 TaxID=2841527 RepID=UPI001C0FE664|nr:flagellar basal body rod protein FlgB [Caproiciproducens sp. MSJ-32]MBU5454774.1 flagellar basal body rod protein FlgB [Caproiciproducens sp. MSJ-32]
MNINNKDSTYKILKLGLDASSLRGKVIANNIANINTKNFKKSYVTFEENLTNEKNKLSLKKTNVEHLNGKHNNSLISIEQDNSTSMRQDGNNVDLDLEKVNQAANTMMYNALITQANSKLSMTKSVISGGN